MLRYFMLQPGSGSMPENIGFDPNLRKSPQDAKPGEGRCRRENEKGARIRFQRSLFRVIPARFERATRSLEGCCSIQLSYGTIGKTAPCGDDLRRKDRNFFHNSPRLNEKYRFPQGCNGLQPRGNPIRGTTLHSHKPALFPAVPAAARHAPYPAEKQPVAPIFRRIILPGGIFCLHLQA